VSKARGFSFRLRRSGGGGRDLDGVVSQRVTEAWLLLDALGFKALAAGAPHEQTRTILEEAIGLVGRVPEHQALRIITAAEYALHVLDACSDCTMPDAAAAQSEASA
jgi:hypothetical protein